jgi:hypothetical protein
VCSHPETSEAGYGAVQASGSPARSATAKEIGRRREGRAAPLTPWTSLLSLSRVSQGVSTRVKSPAVALGSRESAVETKEMQVAVHMDDRLFRHKSPMAPRREEIAPGGALSWPFHGVVIRVVRRRARSAAAGAGAHSKFNSLLATGRTASFV